VPGAAADSRPSATYAAYVDHLAPMLMLDPRDVQVITQARLGSEPAGLARPGVITLAGELGDPGEHVDLLLHELVHLAQHANRAVLSRRPDATAAEAEAAGIVAAHAARRPLWQPREVLPDGHAARGDGAQGVSPAVAPSLSTVDDNQALALVMKTLDTEPDGDQRRGAITFLVGLAMRDGPAQQAASDRLTGALTGVPVKNLFDHMTAIEDLKEWIPTRQGERAYDFILLARAWFADHSKDEIGSGLSVSVFQKYLHYRRGTLAVDYLKRKLTGGGTLVPSLAARMIADLLERQGTPEAARFQPSYAALRVMAMANGWESFGPLGAASATPVIFSALDALRQQARNLAEAVLLGPLGDPWEDTDIAALNRLADSLDVKGAPRTATGALAFTAENREEVEHEVLSMNPVSSAAWLLEMARTLTIAVDGGARVQEQTRVLHASALALDQILGDQGRTSDERLALFDVRHDNITAWLGVGALAFGPGQLDVAGAYAAELSLAAQKFERFDQALAVRKFKGARARFGGYAANFAEGENAYPGNDQLDEAFFFTMRNALEREKANLEGRLATGFTGQLGDGTMVVVPPAEDAIPADLQTVVLLDRDVSLFGMQAALFLVYATNLTIHNTLLKAGVGTAGFRAEQGKLLSDQRTELMADWTSGNFQAFLDKADKHQLTLTTAAENIKHQAKIDFLLSLVVTIIATLVTEGAALAVRLASVSELVALGRTAQAVESFSTLVNVGVFTASQLTLQRMIFGKEITGLDVVKTAATNLAFLGALSAVGKFVEPLAQGSAVRQLLIGHLAGFAGTAVVSAALGRIETGQWPPDIATFLSETAITYLVIAGLHHSFTELVAKPALRGAVETRMRSLAKADQALLDTVQAKVDAGTLTRQEFDALRAERVRLLEEAREVARMLKGGRVITEAEYDAIARMIDEAVSGTRSAVFPLGALPSPVAHALRSPDTLTELTRSGDTSIYVYDPARPRAAIDALLAEYRAAGFTVAGPDELTRVVDPEGRTVFILVSAPVASTRRLLPATTGGPGIGPLERATGLRGPALDAARASVARVNREAESVLVSEYDDYEAIVTLAMLVEQASVAAPRWPIDAVRGLADALSLRRGIPHSAVRRLFRAIPADRLPEVLATYHAIANSPKVEPGTNFLIADDLMPASTVRLIFAWRSMQARGLGLPPDMDMRATRGLLKLVIAEPTTWLDTLAGIPVERRAERLRAMSGLVDPTVTLTTSMIQLLAFMVTDIPGHPGFSPLAGATAEDFVKQLESRAPSGKFADPQLRAAFVRKVDAFRMDVRLIQQGVVIGHGNLEGVMGRANEVRQVSRILLGGSEIIGFDRDVGPKPPLPSVNLAGFLLPGGGQVINAPSSKDVHLDLLYIDPAGQLTAMEISTAPLKLPEPWVQLDPRNPAYGADIDWSAVDVSDPPAHYRKFLQAVKIYQLNQAARALSTSWTGQPVNPAEMVMSAGDFTAPAARALEALGFRLELSDGTRVTATQVEASKRGGKSGM
jgi:hypothetical protein